MVIHVKKGDADAFRLFSCWVLLVRMPISLIREIRIKKWCGCLD